MIRVREEEVRIEALKSKKQTLLTEYAEHQYQFNLIEQNKWIKWLRKKLER